MELFTFGDSWTAGLGCNLKVENSFTDENDRKIYRNSMSWPKYLAEHLGINFTNLSKAGSSNKEIFDTIVETIKSNIIKDNDLVVIMWSSSLRDTPLFFPNDEWHVWGKNYTNEKWKFQWVIGLIKDAIVRSKNVVNSKYNLFLKSYKEFYIDNLYNDSYYNIVNQNYILFIQKLLEAYNINYVFCDAFDFMVDKTLTSDLDKTHFINKSNYYKFGEVTFKDFLISIDPTDSDLWEDSVKWTDTPGKHPNAKGYQKISDELYNFIINSNIIKDNKNKLIFKML